jgi:hypothetical protein
MRDGKKLDTQEIKDINGSISQVKAIAHSLLLQEKNSISFFKFAQADPTISKCKMLEDIVDFTFDSGVSSPNILYALNSKSEIYVFELNTNHHTCKTLGKVSVKDSSETSRLLSWGSSLLAVTNSDDTAITLIELLPDAKDFVALNVNMAEYKLPQCEEGKS